MKITIIDFDTHKVLKRENNLEGVFIFEGTTRTDVRTQYRSFNIWIRNDYTLIINEEWFNN